MTGYQNNDEKERDIVNLTRFLLCITNVPTEVYNNNSTAHTQIDLIVSTILDLRYINWEEKEMKDIRREKEYRERAKIDLMLQEEVFSKIRLLGKGERKEEEK